MAGEKSKSSGEYGEKIAQEFFKLIGWDNAHPGVDIPCINKDHKNTNGNPRKSHGVDFIVKYECPLKSKHQADLLISVKHRKNYPSTNDITKEFKSYLHDLSEATECYPSHRLFKINTPGTNKKEISNVIMWFSSALEDTNKGVIDEVQNFRNTENINYKTTYLVDNKKANYLFSSIEYAKNKDNNFNFFYPDTGLNMDTMQRTHQGHILPVQYINSAILLFRISENCLVITTEDEFSVEFFKRILHLARLLTESWANSIIIACPNYNAYNNDEKVHEVISQLKDHIFADQISIEGYNYSDFRNLGGK